MKWLCLLGVLLLFCLSFQTPAFCGGQDVFLTKCGSCHRKGGQAPPVNPADKAASVWKKYFRRHRHPVDLENIISSEELQQIVSFLEEHAADSDQPEAALIPK
ncbi:c-type cytochrome [Thermosulfuriphilus sp.]